MTALHATHLSPYDETCPDCAGMTDDDTPIFNDGGRWASVLAAIGLVALVVIALAVQGAHRG